MLLCQMRQCYEIYQNMMCILIYSLLIPNISWWFLPFALLVTTSHITTSYPWLNMDLHGKKHRMELVNQNIGIVLAFCCNMRFCCPQHFWTAVWRHVPKIIALAIACTTLALEWGLNQCWRKRIYWNHRRPSQSHSTSW